jgi:hypothetical protein
MLCGHFLIPFWTFFAATLLGKAAIKCNVQVNSSINLQALAVIILFQKDFIQSLLKRLFFTNFPILYSFLIKNLESQHETKLASNTGKLINGLLLLWNYAIICMSVFFVATTIESLAHSQMKKNLEKKIK